MNDPGPHQVLALAEELELTKEQRQATRELYNEIHTEAVRLGKEIVALEQKLNRIFAWGQASAENIEKIVSDIGVLKARLRLTHLSAHIRERELLTKEQVRRYDDLRGHGEKTGDNANKMGCNATHHHGR